MTAEMEIVKSKAESPFRWAILFFTCIMMIGNYYSYDIPAALNSQMDDYMGKPSDFETLFSLLYTVYSVPNVFLPFFGGYFVDRFGVRICLLIFAVLIAIGQAVFAFGLSIKSWPIMYLGRVIYGFGGENLGVGNSAILSVWFKGKELAFAFGLNLSVARLGSVINNLVSPALANGINIEFAFWFGVILCGGSIASVVFISSIDKYLDSVINQKGMHRLLPTDQEDAEYEESSPEALAAAEEKQRIAAAHDLIDEHLVEGTAAVEVARTASVDALKKEGKDGNDIKFKDIFTFPMIFWIISFICCIVYGCVLPFNNIASALLLERDYFMDPPSGCRLTNIYQCEDDSITSPTYNPPFDCPSSKWYQPPIPTNYTIDDIDCTDDFWSNGCGKTFCDRQSDAQVQAGTIMSIPYIISAVLSPVLGGFVDRFGARAIIATLSPSALAIVHLFLGLSDVDPVGPLVGQGLAYSMFAAVIWPSVALVIDEKLVGFGYGIVVSIQNMGLAAFPLIVAAIYQANDNKYIPNCEMFFVSCALAGVFIGFVMNYYDYFLMGSILNSVRKKAPADEDAGKKKSVSRDSASNGPMKNPILNRTNTMNEGDEKEKVFSKADRDEVVIGFDNSRGSRGSRHSGGNSNSRHHSSEIYATSGVH